MTKKEDIHVFSRTVFESYFVRYAAIIGVAITCTVYLIDRFKDLGTRDLINLLFLVLVFFVLHYLMHLLSRRLVFRLTINVNGRKIKFVMFKNDEIFNVRFEDIDRIYVNFYVTFVFGGRKVLYHGLENDQLINVLQAHKQIDWGFFGKWTSRKSTDDQRGGTVI